MTDAPIPLIASPSPRDIPQFEAGLDTIEYDKLLVKYHHPKRAYKIIRDYFLDNDYTHLVLHPDDLIADVTHFDKLLANCNDYPVLSGICNVDVDSSPYLLAADITALPNPIRDLRRYTFVPKSRNPNRIVKAYWAGFPFMFIQREVVEKIPFEDDTRYNLNDTHNQGWAFDVTFCYSCSKLGIPIYVDFSVFMNHLKGAGHEVKTGRTAPKVIQKIEESEKWVDVTRFCHEHYLTPEDWTPYPYVNPTTRDQGLI